MDPIAALQSDNVMAPIVTLQGDKVKRTFSLTCHPARVAGSVVVKKDPSAMAGEIKQ